MKLKNANISDSDYKEAKEIISEAKCRDLGQYMSLYLLIDVLLLAYIFYSFRKIIFKTHFIDPSHFVTLPSMSMEAALLESKEEIELLDDIDIHTIFGPPARPLPREIHIGI